MLAQGELLRKGQLYNKDLSAMKSPPLLQITASTAVLIAVMSLNASATSVVYNVPDVQRPGIDLDVGDLGTVSARFQVAGDDGSNLSGSGGSASRSDVPNQSMATSSARETIQISDQLQ